MKNLIIFLYQSYLLYRYEQKGIIFNQEYCKTTRQYYGCILDLNTGVRIDISNNIKTSNLFRRLLIIELKRNDTKIAHIQKTSPQRTQLQKTG